MRQRKKPLRRCDRCEKPRRNVIQVSYGKFCEGCLIPATLKYLDEQDA